jgi:hypothetical protein
MTAVGDRHDDSRSRTARPAVPRTTPIAQARARALAAGDIVSQGSLRPEAGCARSTTPRFSRTSGRRPYVRAGATTGTRGGAPARTTDLRQDAAVLGVLRLTLRSAQPCPVRPSDDRARKVANRWPNVEKERAACDALRPPLDGDRESNASAGRVSTWLCVETEATNSRLPGPATPAGSSRIAVRGRRSRSSRCR